MENLLAKFVNSGRGVIPNSERPCSLKVYTKRRDLNGARTEVATIELKMRDGDKFDDFGDKLKCLVAVNCVVLGDTKETAVAELPCSLVDKNTGQEGKLINSAMSLVIQLTRGERYRLEATCKPGVHDVVRFDVEVKPPNSGNKKVTKST
jgi:hypothetical protein